MKDKLLQSYRCCKRIVRKRAGNFYYAFLLLPKQKRAALYAVYSFMRQCDDLVDDIPEANLENKKEVLNKWKEMTQKAFETGVSDHPIFPALLDTIQRFSIPRSYFFELISGVGMDLEKKSYEKFEDLYQYCYRVASIVGLVCICIFGYRDRKALEYAEAAGIAFQLTNILRDIREDQQLGRIYIPLEDLKRFRCSETSLQERIVDERFRKLLHFEFERARDYYAQGEKLVSLINEDSQRALAALFGIYKGLLEKISRQESQVFEKRIHLSFFEKLKIVYKAWRNSEFIEAA
jgi:phytoene synthase